MRELYIGIISFWILVCLSCTSHSDGLSKLNVKNSFSPIPNVNESIATENSDEIYYSLKFHYKEGDEIITDYAESFKINRDIDILNNFAKKLELTCRFTPTNSNPVPGTIETLGDLDNYFDEWSKEEDSSITYADINIYLDSVWHATTPNSFRYAELQDSGNYIFIRKNELGNVTVLLHELLHYLLLPSHERIVENDKLCSYLPHHLTAENIKICEDYDKTDLVAHCFNVLSESFYMPLNVFLTEPQKKWINSGDCFDESSMEELCDFNLPKDWRNILIETHNINFSNCCIVSGFTKDDVGDFLEGMSDLRVNDVYIVDSLIYALLECENSVLTNVSHNTAKINSDQEIQANEGGNRLNVVDLNDEIEQLRSQVLLDYKNFYGIQVLQFSKEEAIWERNFDLAKRFLIWWFRHSDVYKDWLMIECQLLCQGVIGIPSSDSTLANNYFEWQNTILDQAGDVLKDWARGNKSLDISTSKDSNEIRDSFWIISEDPSNLSIDTINNFAWNLISKPNEWRELNGSDWISIGSKGLPGPVECFSGNCVDCAPFVFEYCFNLEMNAITTFDFAILCDDNCEVNLISPNDLIQEIHSSCGVDSNYVNKTEVYQVLPLQSGKNCISVNVYNNNSPIEQTGFNISGYIEAPKLKYIVN